MNSDIRTISAEDGHTFECFTLTPDQDVLGCIVILQEIFGVTDQLKGLARQYAEQGYVVAIPALFDRQGPRLVIPFDEGPKAKALMAASDLDKTMLDIKATVLALKSNASNVAVMGFCWGGGLALRAAQKLDIKGAIVFYGTRLTTYLDSQPNAPVLGHFGSKDAHVPEADLKQAQSYLSEFEVHVYEAGHAFANNERDSYVPSAASLAHERNLTFLQRVLA